MRSLDQLTRPRYDQQLRSPWLQHRWILENYSNRFQRGSRGTDTLVSRLSLITPSTMVPEGQTLSFQTEPDNPVDDGSRGGSRGTDTLVSRLSLITPSTIGRHSNGRAYAIGCRLSDDNACWLSSGSPGLKRVFDALPAPNQKVYPAVYPMPHNAKKNPTWIL